MARESRYATRMEFSPGTGNHHMWWAAFTRHVGSNVLVTDSSGRFLFANRAAQQFLNPKQGDLVGRTWHDVLPTDVADERLAYARSVLETQQPVALIGMVKGTCRCAIFHPIDSDDTAAQTLIVICHSLTALDPRPDLDRSNGLQVVIAQSNDLGPLSVLTEREFEVLAHLGEGRSMAEIAKRLYRSPKTVEWHRGSLGAKLGAANRLQLARIAIRAGLTHVGLVDTRLRVGSRVDRTERPSVSATS